MQPVVILERVYTVVWFVQRDLTPLPVMCVNSSFASTITVLVQIDRDTLQFITAQLKY